MKHLFDIFGWRELDDWRDRHVLTAAKILNQVATDLVRDLDAEFKAATWKEGFLSPQTFITDKVDPRLREATELAVEMVVAGANTQLAEIVSHQAVWTRRPGMPPARAAGFEGAGDLALAAGPIAAGTAIAAALPVMAVTTTGGLLGTGLFAVTVVSWPVVAVGGAAVGVALVTGALNTGRIWSNAEARLRRRVAAHVAITLLQGTPKHPSILDQLTELFTDAASEARTQR